MKKHLLLLLAGMVFCIYGHAQQTFPVNGVKDQRVALHAFTNATIYTDYQTRVENATLLIRGGQVVAVGSSVNIPEGAIVHDIAGKTIYPGFVDPYTTYGMPKPDRQRPFSFFGRSEQIQSDKKGAYNANEAIKAEFEAVHYFTADEKTAAQMRKEGFGAVLSFNADGIARGSSVVVTLAKDTDNKVLVKDRASAHYSLSKGTSSQDYPFSPMGAMALLRQTMLDAQWYATQGEENFFDNTLEAVNSQRSLPQVFEANSWINALRADRIGDEFGIQFIFKGGGNEYQRVTDLKATGASFIIPVNYPDAYDVTDPLDAMSITLAQLKHWELAPTNAAVLEANGVPFAFTARGLKPGQSFRTHVIKAVEAGLDQTAALKALTYTPARLMGVQDKLGSIKAGALANFLITSGNIFDQKTQLHQNWVQGHRYELVPMDVADLTGNYTLTVGTASYDLEVGGMPGKQHMKIVVNDSTTIKVTHKLDDQLISLWFNPDTDNKNKEAIRLSGWLGQDQWGGTGNQTDGSWVSWSAIPKPAVEEAPEENPDEAPDNGAQQRGGKPGGDEVPTEEMGKVIYPFVAYGNEALPQGADMLIKNATVWTLDAQGKIDNADVLIRNGKIAQVGQGLVVDGVQVIDGTGKHLSPGIIDEHSHIALSSVNDVATNSGMVRMQDVVNSDDVNIYRQLSGGTVAAQLLHGSANPIGGQSAIVKFRWGRSPQQMLVQDAAPFIKFALGENVKRSRSQASIRFPLTRMGVEQVYVDAFTRAKEYEAAWNTYNNLPRKTKASAVPPRRDLALETMVEIMNGKRFISCHSYVQSEINMLMKVAERFGFRINTFTHILEGYKVADIMAEHGAGGSSFSDWWNYKYEVVDAIPYNNVLMSMAGVTTVINSDNAEMARRLNQEAAKSVKYGGMDEVEALKMVTLNPAKLLHLDKRMGTIEVGKDADVVLWSDHPLSVYARAEKTIIDGTVYFDAEQDKAKRQQIAAERNRIIQKMKDAKNGGGGARKPPFMQYHHEWHCDQIVGYHQHADH